jgi:hypothetical protein
MPCVFVLVVSLVNQQRAAANQAALANQPPADARAAKSLDKIRI